MAPPAVQLTPEQIANFFPDLNPYMRKLLEGQFLDQGNPYISQLIASMEADANRAYQTGTVPLVRSNLNMSGAYGSALGALAEGQASQDFTRGLMGQLAQTRTGLYESERDRMMQGMQLYSGETVASRQGLFGSRDTDVQAAAQRAAARMAANAQLGSARIGANASMYGARLGAQGDYWRNLFNYSHLMRGFQGGPQNPQPEQPTPPVGPPLPGRPWKPGDQWETGNDPWNVGAF